MIDMKETIKKLEDVEVYELELDEYEGKCELSTLEVEGIVYRFSHWLNDHNISDENPDEVYDNCSGARNGNRIDIHDHYQLFNSEYEISGLYSINGTVYAIVYNKEKDDFYGEIEILPV